MAEPRTTPCDAAERSGRLAKAKQFADAADTILMIETEPGQLTDAVVTLYIHAGIAAADVLAVIAEPDLCPP